MSFSLRLLLIISLITVYAVTTRYLAQRDMASVLYLYSDRIADAQLLDPSQAICAKTLGDRALMNSPPQLDAASKEYKKALQAAPCSLVQWRDWSNINLRLDQLDAARKAFVTAEFLAPNDSFVQLDFGNLLLAEKRPDEAARHHQQAIDLSPSKAPTIYPAYLAIGWTPVQVAETLLTKNPEVLRRYFLQCLTWLDPEGAGELWKHINQAQPEAFDADSYRQYFVFLILNKEYARAKTFWDAVKTKFYERPVADNKAQQQELWNGDFEIPLLFDGGLEWRIQKSLPVGTTAVVTFSDGAKPDQRLWIHFNGEENTAFSHVRHFFFVDPHESYRLKYHVRALGLTTDNGPYVNITIYSDPPFTVKGQIVRGTGEWTFEQEFATPLSAQWAEINICRDKSQKLDNRIKGDVWFDDFVLEKIGGSPDGTEVKK